MATKPKSNSTGKPNIPSHNTKSHFTLLDNDNQSVIGGYHPKVHGFNTMKELEEWVSSGKNGADQFVEDYDGEDLFLAEVQNKPVRIQRTAKLI